MAEAVLIFQVLVVHEFIFVPAHHVNTGIVSTYPDVAFLVCVNIIDGTAAKTGSFY